MACLMSSSSCILRVGYSFNQVHVLIHSAQVILVLAKQDKQINFYISQSADLWLLVANLIYVDVHILNDDLVEDRVLFLLLRNLRTCKSVLIMIIVQLVLFYVYAKIHIRQINIDWV